MPRSLLPRLHVAGKGNVELARYELASLAAPDADDLA